MTKELMMNGNEVRSMLDEGAKRLEAAQTRAAGAAATSVEVIAPLSEAARERLQPPELISVSRYRPLVYGPDGQMITGSSH